MRVLILGAGPTGLSAARRLVEHGHDDWLLVDAASSVGGLSSSIIDSQGFTWDLGGHVLFSHYRYFDRLMDAALGDAWVEHEREAWVWMRERWIPYPFQNNIWRLPDEDLAACLDGLVAVHRQPLAGRRPATFADWLQQAFGHGLCDTFMYPYNFKVWAYDPSRLDTGWMGERVATVDLARVLRNLVHRRDDVSWGPNAKFRFPLRGGTGSIWSSIAAMLPEDQLSLGRRAIAVDSRAKRVRFADGSEERYDALISTTPADALLGMLEDSQSLRPLAERFVHSSSHIVGVGFEGAPPEALRTKCWMYFPEADTPFYRVTVFSNYSPNNVPLPGAQWSLMAEVSESCDKPVEASRIVEDVIAGFRRVGFIDDSTRILSRFHRRLPYGYPTPWLGRDDVLGQVLPLLEERDILSRGRFGAWKYEVSNQDHSSLQGVEAVDRLLLGAPEHTVCGTMNVEPAEPVPR